MFTPYPSPPPTPVHRWQGASGKWYHFNIYPITAIPNWIIECNYFFARPRFDLAQSREPFYIGESGDFDKELANHPKLQPAKLLGATEVHICFLARSRPERLDIETDLRRGHWTPLNYQPTPASLPACGGLGSLAAAVGIGGGIPGLGSWPPAPPPRNALANLANHAPVLGSLGGYRSPFETDLDWLLRS
jgi:hypothetical protein